jgi:RNA polymerase sigma-70 factor (ECF subfamily)
MSGQNKIQRLETFARPCEAILPGAIPLIEEKRLPEQAEVVSSYYKRMFRAAISLTWDRDTAEEIVQETFCSAFSKLDSFSGRSSVFTWLYRIMLNKYRDQCRRKSLLRRLGIVRARTETDTGNATSSAPSPGAQLAVSEERRLLRNAVERLPKRLRMVVVMHYFDGLPINEVAEVLDCRLGTVKSRLFAARKRLFQLLRGKLRDGYTSAMSQI